MFYVLFDFIFIDTMDDLSFELNAPKNLKSKQTGSRKKFPEFSSKNKAPGKENKKPTRSIKLLKPDDDYKKFIKRNPIKLSTQESKLRSVENPKKENVAKEPQSKGSLHTKSSNGYIRSGSQSKGTLQTKSSNGYVCSGSQSKLIVQTKSSNGHVCSGSQSKRTLQTKSSNGYVSSNDSSKMSTTYEFSGSRNGSVSEDSLVQIFKSKLPTSVKINRILTPQVNNVQSKSNKPSELKGSTGVSYPQRSKKLDFTEDRLLSPLHTDGQKVTKTENFQTQSHQRVRQSIHFRNSTDFNTFATPLKATNTKISTPTESETKTNAKETKERNVLCVKSPLAQNGNEPKRQKILGEKFSFNRVNTNSTNKENLPREKNTKRTTRNSKQKSLIPKPIASPRYSQHNSSLFSELSTSPRGSSLSSSLSPSPKPKGSCSSNSIESKESHDSSGSVYVSATELSPSSVCNVKSRNKNNLSKDKESGERNAKDSDFRSRGKTDALVADSQLNDNENGKFCARQLRSKSNRDFSSLMTSISSNESGSFVNSSNAKQFINPLMTDSAKDNSQNNKSSSLISGIEKLNLTKDGQASPSHVSNSILSQSPKPVGTSRTSTSRLLENDSLFSSINSNNSRNGIENKTGDVITISSDSSFDPDFSELSMKATVKESIALCSDSDKSKNASNVSEIRTDKSVPSGKADTHASLYSTMGNVNLTCGVKIRKSKYFFNSSDKSISSIGSEPSCIESSIFPRKGTVKKMNDTSDIDEREEDVSKDKTNALKDKVLDVDLYDKVESSNDRHNDKGERLVANVSTDKENHKLIDSEKLTSCPDQKVTNQEFKSKPSHLSINKGRNLDDLFDRTKVFNGDRWVDKVSPEQEETSFKFKAPTSPTKSNEAKPKETSEKDSHDIDLSTWGTNSRGNVKIKVDRYSLGFNFDKLMGKPETTSTETLDNFSSDVKHTNISKRKSINKSWRKSIEIKRCAVISSDSEADTDDEIRVVSKTKRKQRILDSSDEPSSGIVISSEESEYEAVKPKPKEKKKQCKLMSRLTDDFGDILSINKKPATKPPLSTPKSKPPVSSLDKKSKAKHLTAVPNTPLRTDNISKKQRLTFLSSLSANIPELFIPHPEAAVYKSKFKSKKEELARRLFHLYNKEIFNDRLPSDMPLEWNGRMRTTSGFCYNKRTRSLDPTKPEVRSARIALSKKILDTPDRLRDTLVHELCHAASWLIDGMRDGHGPNWKKWTIYAMQRFPELPPIKRCHDYKIDTKYVYRCSQCDYEFGRHSKSLNLERQVCGYCHGKFILLTNTKQGTVNPAEQNKRPPTQFAMFVKDNYGKVKANNVGIKHGDVMKMLSKMFAESKIKDS